MIARLQNSLLAATSQADAHVFELMIDRQLDRIAANHTEPDDPAEARQAVAAATRRQRYRAQLLRRHFGSTEWGQGFMASPETIYSARQAIEAIAAQVSPQDGSLLLSVGQGETPQVLGLSAPATRKRLSRLRTRFAHLNPHSAQSFSKQSVPHQKAVAEAAVQTLICSCPNQANPN